jgi:hypothetical protein
MINKQKRELQQLQYILINQMLTIQHHLDSIGSKMLLYVMIFPDTMPEVWKKICKSITMKRYETVDKSLKLKY